MTLTMETIGNGVCSVDDTSELARWFARANEPWNPITAAERQLEALIGNNETAPALAAYDQLYERANQAVRWLELDTCPDSQIGRRFRTQMLIYRIVAKTARSTLLAKKGDAVVAQLVDLRELIDRQSNAMGYDNQCQKASREHSGGRRVPQ
jgi:hypothetical protein